MKKKSMKLKERLAEPEITIMPGVHDGYSARIVELSGFDVAWISGAGISESHLGWADRGVMGLQENVTACRDIVNCTDLILLGDADTGYGNAMNVYFSVRAFEQVGLAGVMLEDQTWPKRCGHMAGKDVISREEARDKSLPQQMRVETKNLLSKLGPMPRACSASMRRSNGSIYMQTRERICCSPTHC